MPSRVVTPVAALLGAAALVRAQQSSFPAVPLAEKHFAYPSEIPYKVDTDTNLVRGQQLGYNICNSTTEGQDSLCQTSFLNRLDDFCLWAPPEPNSLIADTEGEEVAWCTKPGKGTRIIPPGALKGVQYMKTPDYVQVVGFIDQTLINIQAGDFGGELDPHGADLRGNPMGSLVYSNAFNASNGNNNTYIQAIEWHNFMGGDAFCFKVCDPAGPRAADLCQHIFDRIGCAYNAPNNARNGTFEACLGNNQDPPGIYTSNGQVMTYTQPPESQGAITSIPYTPTVPASSQCTTFQSADLYSSASSWYAQHVSSVASGSATASGSRASGSGTRSGSGSGAQSNSSSSGSLGAAHPMLAGNNGAGAGAAIAFMGMLAAAMLVA